MLVSNVDTHLKVLRLPVKVRLRFAVILDLKKSQIKREGVIWTSGIPQCKGLF